METKCLHPSRLKTYARVLYEDNVYTPSLLGDLPQSDLEAKRHDASKF
jgi:hypothetical protein